MGTNYYHRFNICSHCRRYDQLHIGKSSARWTFSFRGYRYSEWDDGLVIVSYKDWLERLEKGGEIFNEYGDSIPLENFRDIVENRPHAMCHHAREFPGPDTWTDDEGYSFTGQEFL